MEEKIKEIKLAVFDVDGVLTDGKIVYSNSGKELKFFDVKDGCGMYLLHQLGIKTALITAGNKKIVKRRAKDMKVSHVFCTRDKLKAYNLLKEKFHLQDKNISYAGDDLLDLPVIKKCGFSFVPVNAVEDVKKHADYVSSKKSGEGFVREIAELILKAKNLWADITVE